MTRPTNQELQQLIEQIQDLLPNSRERRKLVNKLARQIGGYEFVNSSKSERIGIFPSLKSLINKDLQLLAGKAKKSNGSSASFHYLVPQKWMQELLYAEAKVNTILYILDNVDKYDPKKNSVKAWVNKTLYWKFLDAFNKEFRGEKIRVKAHAASIDAPKYSNSNFYLPDPRPSKQRENHRLFRELIKNDPGDTLKNILIRSKNKNQICLQKVLLMKLQDKTLQEISEESGVPLKSISSCINRKKAELREYITKYTGIKPDDL
ncbi:MAG: hypothetical protein AAGE84_28860 [Cyanobacteria bacterium P01_G01_bin.39]